MNMTPPPAGASVSAVPTTQSQSQSVDDNFSARVEAAWKHFVAIGKARAAEHVLADIQDAIDARRFVTQGLFAQAPEGPAA